MILCSTDRKKKEKKKVWTEFNKEREKNCSINQVMRGKGIAFYDVFFQPLDLLKIYNVKKV